MTDRFNDDSGLIVFARAPVAGAAKTRLMPALGADGAAACQAALTRHTLDTATRACPKKTILACAPDDSHPFFHDCQRRYPIQRQQQHGRDLGERMHRAMTEALQTLSRIILIGTDCPAIDPDYLLAAESSLSTGHDIVIGPAEDGGYVLIGLSRPVAQLFTGIDWGSERVYPQTRERMMQTGLRWQALPHRWDIDEPADLARLSGTRPDIYQALGLPPLEPGSE